MCERALGRVCMRNKYFSISEELLELHEKILKEWPSLLRVAVALYDKETDMLHTFVRASSGEQLLTHYSYELSKSFSLQAVANTRKPRIIKDLQLLQNAKKEHSEQILEHGFQSSFTIPTYLNEHLLGFIFFDASELDYFTPELQSQLLDYSRLLESMLISEILPIRSLIGIISTTRMITGVRDEETGKHLTRMSHYVELIALELAEKYDLSDENIEYMWFYAPLHDIGKIAIPDGILMKPGRLTKPEFEVMKTHVDEGIKMLDMIVKNFDFQQIHHLDILRKIIAEHHEKLDGSGYPKGLKADEISIVGKITAVADVFDALSNRRVYRDSWSIEKTLNYLQENSGTLFDEDCVTAMIKNKERIIKIHDEFQDKFED